MLRSICRMQRIVLGSSFALAIGVASTANAEEASSDLEIRAGITEALVLRCETSLSFGITRVDLENHDANAFVQVDPDGSVTSQGSSLSTGNGTNGVCTMSGSQAANEDSITVEFEGPSTQLEGKSNAFNGLDEPEKDIDLLVDEFSVKGKTVDENGSATINIGALLTIPKLDANAMGGYSGTIEVTVDDGFGG